MREICIYLEFLTEDHKRQIRETAGAAGFLPHFFPLDQFEEAKACLQRCEVLYAHSPDLLRTAPASLRWYCCSFAGVDPYCGDSELFANPDCLLTNTNCYGVTIAEHVVMVLLILLRRMPEKWAGKKKLGFPVPTRVWLKEEKYYQRVKAAFEGPEAEKFFHTGALVKLLDEHRAGKRDNSRKVWTVYTFLVWYKEFFVER